MQSSPRETTVYVALFAALMAVLGLVPKIDLGFGVPITAQTLGVMLAGCLLGAKRGFLSVLLFLVAVAVGMPLLAGGRGGIGVFFGPTVGYLLSWPIAAAVVGWLMHRFMGSQPSSGRIAASALVASIIGGIVVVHAMGIVGLVLVAGMDWSKAFWGDLIFVPGDLVKAIVCAVVVQTVAKGLPDWNFGRRTS